MHGKVKRKHWIQGSTLAARTILPFSLKELSEGKSEEGFMLV
jgi:hypothetical protein